MLAYATTIHKSQGSEYPAVVIPVHTQHYTMLQRNLLYTAITRGQAAGGAGGAEEGAGHRGAQRGGAAAMVEAARVVVRGARFPRSIRSIMILRSAIFGITCLLTALTAFARGADGEDRRRANWSA